MSELKRLRAIVDEVTLIARFADRTAGPTGARMALHRIVKVLDKHSPIPEPIEPEETTDVWRPGWRPEGNLCANCGQDFTAHVPGLECP